MFLTSFNFSENFNGLKVSSSRTFWDKSSNVNWRNMVSWVKNMIKFMFVLWIKLLSLDSCFSRRASTPNLPLGSSIITYHHHHLRHHVHRHPHLYRATSGSRLGLQFIFFALQAQMGRVLPLEANLLVACPFQKFSSKCLVKELEANWSLDIKNNKFLFCMVNFCCWK